MRVRSAFRWVAAAWLTVAAGGMAIADGPDDNVAQQVRPIPPPGVEIAADVRQALSQGLAALDVDIQVLSAREDSLTADMLPDVQVYSSAVHMALDHGEFFHADEAARAFELIDVGRSRARELLNGQAPWNEARGLVVRGYVSRIDGSVQPYGLVVPETYAQAGGRRHRLDIWFHGRGEKLSEVNFLAERQRNLGEFAPYDAFVLHPYGRYCNANKFAGEIDTLEALDDVKHHYLVDDDRLIVRGFSMGGAACWQFAVHYPDLWCAANPGAGFAETPDFLRVFQGEDVSGAPDHEKKLWHWYDCTGYARNLTNCPTIAYSGEKDRQKQAADIMAAALAKEGVTLRHVIGPNTEHSLHPQAKVEIENALADLAAKGRDRLPRRVRFVTYTLRYNRQAWLTIDALGEHWSRASVDGEIDSASSMKLVTENVDALTMGFPAGWCPLDNSRPVNIAIDGQSITAPAPLSDRSWECRLHRVDAAGGKAAWQLGQLPNEHAPRKRHGLQGPIDDAFMDAFLFVRPTGEFSTPVMEAWTKQELSHATAAWRSQFRGVAPIKDDVEVTADDIANRHLILWGDFASNAVLRRLADRLPIRIEKAQIVLGNDAFPADHHALLLIAPNPENPQRYVVLNSGFTFREYDYLNNARQVPKLPDWSVIDVRTPANARYPGKVVEAGFFDELWQLRRSE